MSPFYVYWPGKAVPGWLETVSFSGTSNGCPVIKHGGFGYVMKKDNKFCVFVLSGNFIVIDSAGMAVHLKGGGGGVMIKFAWWLVK